MKTVHSLAAAGLFALALVGCKREAETPVAADTPAAAVEQLVQALREDDLLRFSQLSVPPELHRQTAEQWALLSQELEAEAGEGEQFDQMMQTLTAPGAEDQLYAQLEPMLDQFDAEFAAQLPLAVAMGSAFANQAIQANETMTPAQKQHATEVLGAVAGWIGTAPLGDRAKAREAIGVLTDTARRFDVDSAAELRTIGYEPMLERMSVVSEGSKRFFAVYGLDINQSLDSVRTSVGSEDGDSAVVRVQYELLGSPVAFDMAMQRIDGGWYSTDLVENARQALEEAPEEEAYEDADLHHDAYDDAE